MKHTITRVECTYYSLSVFPNQGSGKPLVQVFWSTSRGSARCKLQWGLEIRLFEIWKHLKSQLLESWILNGPFFKWLGLGFSPKDSKSRHFFVLFSYPFDISKICNPSSFQPFEIQTCPDFRSSLYQD